MTNAPLPQAPLPATPLPAAEARKRYLVFLAVRLAGLAIMFGGAYLMQTSRVPGLLLILIGGASLLIRPRHLGLTRK